MNKAGIIKPMGTRSSAAGSTTVAARLDSALVARIDRLVADGVVATRAELIERAVLAWADAAEGDRWAAVTDHGDTIEEGFQPAWDDDPADWATLYADVLDAP